MYILQLDKPAFPIRRPIQVKSLTKTEGSLKEVVYGNLSLKRAIYRIDYQEPC